MPSRICWIAALSWIYGLSLSYAQADKAGAVFLSQPYLDRADSLLRKGYYGDAVSPLDSAIQLLKKEGREETLEQAKALTIAGALTWHLKEDYSSAFATHQKALELQRRLYGQEENAETARSYTYLAAMSVESKNWAAAETFYRHALDIYLQLAGGEDTEQTGRLYRSLGLMYTKSNRPEQGLEYLQKSVEVLTRVKASDGEQGQSHSTLGLIFAQRRLNLKARDQLRKGERLLEKSFGKNSVFLGASLFGQGAFQELNGSYLNAVELYQKAEEILATQLDSVHSLRIGVQSRLGGSYRGLARYRQAEEAINRALRRTLASGKGETLEMADLLDELGQTFSAQGFYSKAQDCHFRAAAIKRKLKGEESQEMASTAYYLSQVFVSKGDYVNGETYGKKALALMLRYLNKDDPDIAMCYLNLGTCDLLKGDVDKGLSHFQKALDIQVRVYGADHATLNSTYVHIAVCYFGKGDYRRAIELYQTIQKKLEASFPMGHPSVATSYDFIGICYDYLGLPDTAIAQKQEGIDYLQKRFGQQPFFLSTAYVSMAKSYMGKGVYAQAISWLERAISLLRSMNQRQGMIHTTALRELAFCYGMIGDFSNSMTFFQEALDSLGYSPQASLPQISSPGLLATLKMKGRILLRQARQSGELQRFEEAEQPLLQAEQVLYLMLYGFRQEDSKKAFLIEAQEIYFLLSEACLDRHGSREAPGGLEQAFSYSERSKSFLLYEALRQTRALAFSGIPDSLLQRELKLRFEITEVEKKWHERKQLGAPEGDSTLLALTLLRGEKTKEYESLQSRFESGFPRYFRLKYDRRTVDVAFVQDSLLEAGQTLLEYQLGDSAIFAFVIRRDTFLVATLARDLYLEQELANLREGLTAYHLARPEQRSNRFLLQQAGKYTKAAHALYLRLVAPLEGYLTKDLILIPDGRLGYIPFEALLRSQPSTPLAFEKHDYLLDKYRISYCYSATLLREMKQKKHRTSPAGDFLAFAPFYSGDTATLADLFAYTDQVRKGLEPLPHTGEEVYRARKIMGGTYLSGPEATEQRFQELAGQYRILHLATHAQANDEVGDFSFLAFSEIRDSLENELLFVRDLYNLSLNADLVVLSACETGIGQLQRGEGIISLARAFSYAGAKSIVTTLWQVNDSRSKDLVLAFYQQLKKRNRRATEALQLAKIKLIKENAAHPYYWAGFIGIGDMQGR